jgi:hypothetical protein
MLITRIYTGDDGRSHFEDATLPDEEVRPGVRETAWVEGSRVSLRLIATEREQPRHVAPRRQLAVIVAGELEVECTPGTTRRFPAGSVVLIEDVHGEGHVTRVIAAPCTFVQVALPDPGTADTSSPAPSPVPERALLRAPRLA